MIVSIDKDEQALPASGVRRYIPSVDVLKIAAGFGVVCVHTRPFQETCPSLSAWVVGLSRLAVPLFFAISGFFFQDRILRQRQQPPAPTKHPLQLPLRYYGLFLLWSCFYVLKPPLTQTGNAGIWAAMRSGIAAKVADALGDPVMFLIEGYGGHLWFLSALSLSLTVLWLAAQFNGHRLWLLVAIILCVIAALDGAYQQTVIGIQVPLNTRNGLFIGGLGVALGAWIRRESPSFKASACVCAVIAILHVIEVVFAWRVWGIHFAEMNIMLTTLPLATALLATAVVLPFPRPAPFLRRAARSMFGVYLCHVFFIHPVTAVLRHVDALPTDWFSAPLVFLLSAGAIFCARRVPVVRLAIP